MVFVFYNIVKIFHFNALQESGPSLCSLFYWDISTSESGISYFKVVSRCNFASYYCLRHLLTLQSAMLNRTNTMNPARTVQPPIRMRLSYRPSLSNLSYACSLSYYSISGNTLLKMSKQVFDTAFFKITAQTSIENRFVQRFCIPQFA